MHRGNENISVELLEKSDSESYLDTESFAKKHFVKPASVRSRYCLHGSYFGVIPKKHKNGRLAWPYEISTNSNESKVA